MADRISEKIHENLNHAPGVAMRWKLAAWLRNNRHVLGASRGFQEADRLRGKRDEVDTVSAAALAAGGTEADDAEDHGFMYSRSFYDLDGHGWQVMWMDPAAAEQGDEGSPQR